MNFFYVIITYLCIGFIFACINGVPEAQKGIKNDNELNGLFIIVVSLIWPFILFVYSIRLVAKLMGKFYSTVRKIK